jgi:excisionase family DNA binding protein
MEQPFDQFVDVLEASRTLGVHPDSVRRLIVREELPAYKYANKWLIRKDVLAEFAKTYYGRPGPKPRIKQQSRTDIGPDQQRKSGPQP